MLRTCFELQQEALEKIDPPPLEEVPSLGSIGHQWGLCRRPCIYHIACGACTKGEDCALAELGSAVAIFKVRDLQEV